MESICRLCCSTKFVNNHLFDEENALYLKMELYLPIKVRKLDRLPQKVCDRCSCKVNDLYQFCNEAIEAQHRLHDMLRHVDATLSSTIDLTFAKHETLKATTTAPEVTRLKCDQSTQTETVSTGPSPVDVEVKVKIEPKPFTPTAVKTEDIDSIESDNFDVPEHAASDNSEDNVSLVSLKKKKKGRKTSTNGEVPKKGRKKKTKIADWEMLINSLPESTAVKIVDKPEGPVSLDGMKDEMDFGFREGGEVRVKKEPGEEDVLQCCICFTQCFSRSDMLAHYKQHLSAAEAWAQPPAAPPPPDQQPLRCLRCRKVVERAQWAEHWARHWERDSRPYRCALCEKTFRTASQILKHGLTHKLGEGGADVQEVNKRFVCDLCPEGFVYMRSASSICSSTVPAGAPRARAPRGGGARADAALRRVRARLRAPQLAAAPPARALGRAQLPLQRVRQGAHQPRASQVPHPHPHRLQAQRLQDVRQGVREEVQPDAARARALGREAARVLALREGLQPALHARHTREVPQRRAAVRVRAVRPRLRGQGAAVHAPQDHLHIARGGAAGGAARRGRRQFTD